MFYTWACPRRPIGTPLGLNWDENSYLGNEMVWLGACDCFNYFLLLDSVYESCVFLKPYQKILDL